MNIPNVQSPTPVRPCAKRKLEALDPEIEPVLKRGRLQPPVLDWIGSIPPALTRSQSVLADFDSGTILQAPGERPQSVPAKFNNQLSLTLKQLLGEPKFPIPFEGMGDRRCSVSR